MNSCDVTVSDRPNSKGPSVSSAQYISSRYCSGRVRLTRQIWLNARSTMLIIALDVNSSATAPTADSRVALLANWVRLPMMVFEIPFGITVWTKYVSSDARKVLNTGKVVKIASTMVSSGTSASVVVKVRLPATCGNFSCLSRRPANRNRSRTSLRLSPRTMSTLPWIMSLVDLEST